MCILLGQFTDDTQVGTHVILINEGVDVIKGVPCQRV